MSHQPQRPSSIKIPWLIICSSIITPLYGILNGVDVFYGGLSTASTLAFSFALLSSCVLVSIIFSVRGFRGVKKIITILLASSIAIFFGHVVGTAMLDKGFIIQPHGMSANDANSISSYAIAGSLLGMVTGWGTGVWIEILLKYGLQLWAALILPLAAAVLIVSSGINSFLQADAKLTYILTGFVITISLASKFLYLLFDDR
ncbi:hypothetical protein K9N68_39190 (plasmid) [Kovacikia minuta CCNUW1]|uniref:hypothetical protein n=1 Tax=Kovacikia minuta TaxID=2931930 RepID=UPI001CCE40E8|nr:hypothetical protein [Kovacikia minuta]UBF30170.1 hypothetical protein K9N68_39190 [Kovacikia minuta CCNUW1]